MVNPDAFERLVQIAPSPSNGICFCQGNFAAMGVDVPETIRRLGEHIRFVHVRDVRGTPDHFIETFHDEGPTDMYAAIQAYAAAGFEGVMRPDHVPVLAGESGEAGYTMMGRLFAVGYMRGLIEAAAKSG
jgi:mannonate dehydratase